MFNLYGGNKMKNNEQLQNSEIVKEKKKVNKHQHKHKSKKAIIGAIVALLLCV